MAGRWVDLQTAAAILGTSTEAVRKRATRGTLESEKREDAQGVSRVYVRVDSGRTEGGREPQGETPQAELVASLQDQVEYLRGQLDIRTEELRRKDHIIAALTDRIPELEAPREQPESTQQAQDNAQEPEQEPGRVEDLGEPESRSWWRRVFGG